MTTNTTTTEQVLHPRTVELHQLASYKRYYLHRALCRCATTSVHLQPRSFGPIWTASVEINRANSARSPHATRWSSKIAATYDCPRSYVIAIHYLVTTDAIIIVLMIINIAPSTWTSQFRLIPIHQEALEKPREDETWRRLFQVWRLYLPRRKISKVSSGFWIRQIEAFVNPRIFIIRAMKRVWIMNFGTIVCSIVNLPFCKQVFSNWSWKKLVDDDASSFGLSNRVTLDEDSSYRSVPSAGSVVWKKSLLGKNFIKCDWSVKKNLKLSGTFDK